jgi:hypothetical protein
MKSGTRSKGSARWQAGAPLARLICNLNAELNVPGFFLDESVLSIGFRQALLHDGDGATPARQLLTACDLVVVP